jgi:hypothetical protein
MADFHYRHAGAREIEELFVRLLQHFQRQRGRTSAEVV